MVGVGPVAIRVSKIRYRYQRQHERVWSDGSLFGREYITQGLEPRREYILLPYRVNIYYCPIGWIYITVQCWAGIYWTFMDIEIYSTDYVPSMRFKLPYRIYFLTFWWKEQTNCSMTRLPIITGDQPVSFSPVQKITG